MATLDKINTLPLTPLLTEATGTLREGQRTLRDLQKGLKQVNQIVASPAMKVLPEETQRTLLELNRSMKGLQPGSPAYNKMVGDMQRLDRVLQELQPLLNTLNGKSNALIIDAKRADDPVPVRAKQESR